MKNLNTNLLKVLIETDFLLLSSSKVTSKITNLRHVDYSLKGSSLLNSTFSLEIGELVKSLKQTIRLLQFIKAKESNKLYICTSNKQYLNLLNTYLNESNFKNSISIKGTLAKTNSTKDISQLLLLLDEPLGNNKKVFKKLFEEKIYLINKINSKIEANNWGTYKMYNSFSDFKKLIFLIVLLRQTLL